MQRLRKAKRLEPVPFLRDHLAIHAHPRSKWAPLIWSQIFATRTDIRTADVPEGA